MTEQTPEQPELDETPPEAPEPTTSGPAFDAPADAADDVATGYAVYDRQLGRYVTGVTKAKPSKADARKAAGDHPHAIVKV